MQRAEQVKPIHALKASRAAPRELYDRWPRRRYDETYEKPISPDCSGFFREAAYVVFEN